MLAAFWHTFRRDIMVTGREFMPFLMQVVVQPLCLLFIFGKVMPSVGATQQLYPAFFLPGVVGLNIALVGVQSVTISLMLDLSSNREIDDRLLAPLPISLVALEKVVFAAVRSLVAGGLAFPLAYLILGSGYQVRTDALLPMFGVMILGALCSGALGLVIGTLLPADKIYLLFTLIFSATLYTGCVYFSWASLSSMLPLQIVTLFNPLTYISEGLRYTMIPLQHGQAYVTLPIGWVLLGLIGSFALFLFIGLRAFHKRVIS
ncbi:transport permease protein [Dictyobacter formicarum]|uniref:Transport permease protein n=2 Tax=Dictyobacter formicarum TaxID=2778368 RepID=A0ABQ3VV56_9CHLR|nr:transport permease protein [Dictyobacter formicarum]